MVLNMNLFTKETFPFELEEGALFARTWLILSGANVAGGKSFLNEWRTIFCDRLYTSVPLALHLLAYKTALVGTCISGRKYLPFKDKTNKNEHAKGTTMFRHEQDMSFVNWYDNNVVKILYTDPEFVTQLTTVERWEDGDEEGKGHKESITLPAIVKHFQTYMRTVDIVYALH